MKTLEEYIAQYNKKAPIPFERDERYELHFNPEHGFCEIGDNGRMIIAKQMCGDLFFWRKAIEEISRLNGYPYAGTYCVRNIRAYIRLAHFSIDKIVETEDGTRYFCHDKQTGQYGQASPAGKFDNGATAYYITWEV